MGRGGLVRHCMLRTFEARQTWSCLDIRNVAKLANEAVLPALQSVPPRCCQDYRRC